MQNKSKTCAKRGKDYIQINKKEDCHGIETGQGKRYQRRNGQDYCFGEEKFKKYKIDL